MYRSERPGEREWTDTRQSLSRLTEKPAQSQMGHLALAGLKRGEPGFSQSKVLAADSQERLSSNSSSVRSDRGPRSCDEPEQGDLLIPHTHREFV